MKCRAYLDIETTGLSPRYSDLTVVGLALEQGKHCRITQLVGQKISVSRLLGLIRKAAVLYTYNGSRFDLPFINAKLGIDLKKHCSHKDLMYDCWARDLYGGLKVVEKKLGIARKLQNINGRVAVDLWYRYEYQGDRQSLAVLLEYNKEDVLNLRVLRKKLQV